jgi:ATP-dependent RNA helicase RhlE
MKFADLGLSEPILRAVAAEGYSIPTPIQIKAIPHVLEGRDVLGCAQTGTGKTAAFALPMLDRLAAHHTHAARGHASHAARSSHQLARSPRALILCPTRELATQIAESFRAYGRNLKLRLAVLFGGVSQHHQVIALKGGVDIIVATPGRLLDLMNQGYVDLRAIEIFVLDEADRMLDMGFLPDMRRIIAKIPARRQTLLFSATMPQDIRQLADSVLHEPVSVTVTPVASTVETIAQSVYFVTRQQKPALLTHLLRQPEFERTLVFTRTKHGADRVVKVLERSGIRAAAIHGNKSQNNRTRALNAFKSSQPPVLVATDIASRGIDVDDVTHVINFDMPNVPETYVHRIGRTARAGADGVAVSFCDHEERADLRAIERLTGLSIPVQRDLPELPADRTMPKERDDRRAAKQSRPDRGHASHGGHERGRQRVQSASARSGGKSGGTRQQRSVHPLKRAGADRAANSPAAEPARGSYLRRSPARGRRR